MDDVERLLGDITPRAASVTLLLLDRVLDRYAQEKGVALSQQDRRTIERILRHIARKDHRR